jgi:hypothetical protein
MDFVIDMQVPTSSLAFKYRLIANICMVIICAVFYLYKKPRADSKSGFFDSTIHKNIKI